MLGLTLDARVYEQTCELKRRTRDSSESSGSSPSSGPSIDRIVFRRIYTSTAPH